MPDTAQDKTEPPTARRREEARQQGQVGKSSDLSAAVVLLGALMLLHWTGRGMLARLLEMTRFCLGGTGTALGDAGLMLPTLTSAMQALAAIVLPVMLLVLVLALVTSFAQVGFLFTLKPITPSLNKLNPIGGLKRMFGGRAFVMLLMGLAKMSLLVLVAYWTMKSRLHVLAHASGLPHLSMVGVAAELFYTLGLRLAIVLLLLAIIDLIYQRYKVEKELKMTKEEVKDELKRMEGDPKIRQRRRQVQMQLALQRIQAAVPKSDVVITNPTEYAVAIQYEAEAMRAPKVTAKGADWLARRIRDLAIQHGVPIVERKPLARALYKTVEVGQEIPVQFYKAVAEILAYVYELAGKGRRRRTPAGMAMK